MGFVARGGGDGRDSRERIDEREKINIIIVIIYLLLMGIILKMNRIIKKSD